MTEEEIKALKDAKEAAERRAAEAETLAQAMKVVADNAKSSLNGVVEELKTERQLKNEALAKANINSGGQDVSSLIEQAFATREQERKKTELEQAIAEFKGSKTEFQTDTAGLVYGKFQEHLTRFNLNDLNTKEQAKARLEEIYRFVNFKEQNGNDSTYEGTPQSGTDVPDNSGRITQETEQVIKDAGIAPEKFNHLREKYSEAMQGLGIIK